MATGKNRDIFLLGELQKFFSSACRDSEFLWMIFRTSHNANENFTCDILGLKQGRWLNFFLIRTKLRSKRVYFVSKAYFQRKFFL